jgi:twitching motility protein PilT
MGWTTAIEQRRNRRVSAQMPLRYRIREESGDWSPSHRSKTTNISTEGLAFFSSLSIPITARLALDISLPDRSGTLKAEGNLVRVARELPDDTGFEYGVALDMNTISEADKLQAFVRSIDVFPLLEMMNRRGATDMHLTAFSPPMLRIQGRLTAAEGDVLRPHVVETLVLSLLNSDRRSELKLRGETHFSFMMPEAGRWRVSAYSQRGCTEAVFHAISHQVPSLYDLDLPEAIHRLLQEESGLILVAGGLRSGKSTTLAALIDTINARGGQVVTTIEDPIEYVHENEKGIVKQREVGTDTPSVAEAVRHVLRQDPNVIVIDAALDAESLDLALHAAETGRLVIAAVHGSSIVGALERLASVYPPYRRAQALRHIARPLRAAWWQVLLPTGEEELVISTELLIANAAVRNAIAQDHLDLVPSLLDNTPGCVALDADLRRLLNRGLIDYETAVRVARFPDDFQAHLSERRGR